MNNSLLAENDKRALVSIAQLLDSFAKRPELYVHPVTFATVKSFLQGLKTGCFFAELGYSWDNYAAAAIARGWDPRGSTGILRDFREKGITEETMIQELIAIEANAYRKAHEATVSLGPTQDSDAK